MKFTDERRVRLSGDWCVYCGQVAETVEHFPPKSYCLDGLLMPACKECNSLAGTDWLTDVENLHKNTPDMVSLKSQLLAHGWGFRDMMALDKAYARALAEYNDPNNEECLLLQKCISAKLSSLKTIENISDFLDAVYSLLLSAGEVPAPYQDKFYVYALTVLVQYEKL